MDTSSASSRASSYFLAFPRYNSMSKRLPGNSIELIGERMTRRKEMFARRTLYGDVTCFTSVFGWLLAVANTEMCMAHIVWASSAVAFGLKLTIGLCTAASIVCIVAYFVTETRIYMLDNAIDDWRMAVTRRGVVQLLLETLVCSVQPLPNPFAVRPTPLWPPPADRQANPDGPYVCDGEWDAFLTILMVCRVYVVCRCLKLHNKFFSDLPCQTIGSLNRVRVNFFFVFKSYLIDTAEVVFAVIIIFMLLWTAWSFRACEAYLESPLRYFFNSLYLSAITFTTIGYGDLTARTVCGRSIAVLTAFCGIASTALTVAVMSSHLEMSKNEKYFYAFMMELRRQKELRLQSANVIKFAWKVFKSRSTKESAWQHVMNHRNLVASLTAIHHLRRERPLMDLTMQLQELQAAEDRALAALKDIQQKMQQIEKAQSRSVKNSVSSNKPSVAE